MSKSPDTQKYINNYELESQTTTADDSKIDENIQSFIRSSMNADNLIKNSANYEDEEE